MRYLIYKWFWSTLDVIFPPSCAGCGALGKHWCQICQAEVQLILPPFCEICGEHIQNRNTCSNCNKNPLEITSLRSWARFSDPLRKAIHQLKYDRNIGLGDYFSEFLSDVLISTGWKIEVVIPVPLGVARRRERGYNQASLLAKPIALKFDYSYQPTILSRTRETISQTKLNNRQRKENVAGAFFAPDGLINGKSVLIVDDVTTSGSTLNSCADALFQAGAETVYGLTLARAGQDLV